MFVELGNNLPPSNYVRFLNAPTHGLFLFSQHIYTKQIQIKDTDMAHENRFTNWFWSFLTF